MAAAPNLLLVHRILLPHYVFKIVSVPKYTLGCDLRNVIIKPIREQKNVRTRVLNVVFDLKFVSRVGQMFSIKTHTALQLLNEISVAAWGFLIRFCVGLTEKRIRGVHWRAFIKEKKGLSVCPCKK